MTNHTLTRLATILALALSGALSITCSSPERAVAPGINAAQGGGPHVVVTPSSDTLTVGDTQQFSATLQSPSGTAIARHFTWTSSNTAVVAISSTGLVTASGEGTAIITATAQPYSGTALVTVKPVPTGILAHLPLDGNPAFVALFGNSAYISRPFSNQVEILDLTSDAFTGSIAVGNLPCGVVFNGSGTRAYVANQFSDNVSIINTATGTQIGTIALNGDPLPVIMPAGDSVLFVTTNANKLFKINLVNNTVVDSLPLVATSHHMFVHPNDTLLYVATRDGGTVMEINWRTMTTVRTFSIGAQTLGMEMAPDRSELYVTTTSNALYIVTLSNGAISSAPTQAGATTIALSTDGTKLYVGELFAGQVEVLDRATRAHVRTITTGGVVREMVTDPARNRVVVTNESGWVDIVR